MSGFPQRFCSTNDSINTWASASRKSLEEKYQLEDPLTALSNEADQITPGDVSEQVACIRAIDGLTHLFEKLCVKSPDEDRVIEEVRDKVFAKINGTDLSKLSMYELIERIHAQQANSFSPHASGHIRRKMHEIKVCKTARGIFYKVINQFEVPSYLVGTLHSVPQGTLPLSGRASQILSDAQELILEFEPPEIGRVEKETPSASDGFDEVLDLYLLEKARNMNKSISFLESREYTDQISRKDKEI